MSIILPIMLVALILGLCRQKIQPIDWAALVLVILLALARYAATH